MKEKNIFLKDLGLLSKLETVQENWIHTLYDSGNFKEMQKKTIVILVI